MEDGLEANNHKSGNAVLPELTDTLMDTFPDSFEATRSLAGNANLCVTER